MGERDEVASALNALVAPGAPLDPLGFRLPGIGVDGGASYERTIERQRLMDRYVERQSGVPTAGMAALITAGPPGAGKSALLRADHDAASWRLLDADIVKDLILIEELSRATFRDRLSIALPDGYPVMPRELAGLVHRESVIVLDAIRRRCMAVGENIILEGTLSWAAQGERLLRELAGAGYERVDILDVEVPLPVALERVTARWWAGRLAAVAGTDPLGGRFTAAAVVSGKYTGGVSLCQANARAAFESSAAAGFHVVRLTVHSGAGTETFTR